MRTMHDSIDNTEDLIDSRDVIARLEHLEYLKDAPDLEPDADRITDEELEELKALRELAEEAENVGDWLYGATLIRDSHFEDYARELAEDIGAVPSDYSWPASHIDWEAAADALKMDYTSVDFDGVTYWVR